MTEINLNVESNEDVKTSETENPQIFDYLDYRKYLEDFLKFKKARKSGYSMQILCNKAGIKYPSLLKMILCGKRNLTSGKARGIAQACGLGKRESQYFLALVLWNQCKEPIEKELMWNDLLKLLPTSEVYLLRKAELEIVKDWRAFVLMEMTRLEGFRSDPEWIAERFWGDLTPPAAKHIIEQLKTVGLVREEGDKLQLTNNIVFHGGEIPSEFVKAYHRSAIPAGYQALSRVPVTQREFSGTCVGVGKNELCLIKEKIKSLQAEIMELSAKSSSCEEIYQLNIQFFPATKGSV